MHRNIQKKNHYIDDRKEEKKKEFRNERPAYFHTFDCFLICLVR